MSDATQIGSTTPGDDYLEILPVDSDGDRPISITVGDTELTVWLSPVGARELRDALDGDDVWGEVTRAVEENMEYDE